MVNSQTGHCDPGLMIFTPATQAGLHKFMPARIDAFGPAHPEKHPQAQDKTSPSRSALYSPSFGQTAGRCRSAVNFRLASRHFLKHRVFLRYAAHTQRLIDRATTLRANRPSLYPGILPRHLAVSTAYTTKSIARATVGNSRSRNARSSPIKW